MKKLNYFAFASNLKESLFEERIGHDRPLSVNVGRLIDYALCFNHRQADGQGRANIIKKKILIYMELFILSMKNILIIY